MLPARGTYRRRDNRGWRDGGVVTITNRRDEKIAAWAGCVVLGYGLGYRL